MIFDVHDLAAGVLLSRDDAQKGQFAVAMQGVSPEKVQVFASGSDYARKLGRH